MTLQQFFDTLSNNPLLILAFFTLIPFTALVAGVMGKGEGHLSPWSYLYSTLVYLIAIPGIFAITLNIYLFIFERQSIFQTNIYTQILPVLSMIVTLWLISRNVELDLVPGFGKLSGLLLMILALFVVLWIIEKTRIYAITFIPFHYFLLIFAALLLISGIGWKRLSGKS